MQKRKRFEARREDSHDDAVAAFLARKLEIDAMLQLLAALSANHFRVDPEDVEWGHVGTLGHLRELLN